MSKARGHAQRSLRAQLSLYTASILAPGLICMSLLVLASVQTARRSHEQQLLATARAVSASIDQRLNRALALNEAVATSDSLLRGDWATAEARAQRLSGPDAFILLSDAQGRQIFNTNRQARPPERPAFPLPPNIQEAFRTGRSRVSNVFFGPAARRQLVAVDTPVTVSGKTYSLSFMTPPETFLRDFAKVPISEGALITLVDRDHHVVARSRLHERFVAASATDDMKRILRQSAEGVAVSRTLEGKESVVAYTRSAFSGWTTMVVVPRTAFEGPLWRNLLGIGLITLLVGVGAAVGAQSFARTIARELRLLRQDAEAVGHGRKVAARPSVIDDFAQVQGALSEASRELQAHDARQRLMIHELNHRVKNTLATVQSLALQTFRGDDPDARAKFDQRLAALADGHDLLTNHKWEQVELAEIVARCSRMNESQIVSDGPAVTLQPQAALALCMCLHELMTNSAKYGALSSRSGKVAIRWALAAESDRLSLEWRESGGPRVSPPGRLGFGTRLIDRLMKHELSGRVERRFELEGIVFTAEIGLASDSRWRNEFRDGAG